MFILITQKLIVDHSVASNIAFPPPIPAHKIFGNPLIFTNKTTHPKNKKMELYSKINREREVFY